MFSPIPRSNEKLLHWNQKVTDAFLTLPVPAQQPDFQSLFKKWDLSLQLRWTPRICNLGQFCARCTAVLNFVPIPAYGETFANTRIFHRFTNQVYLAATVFQKMLGQITKARLFDSFLVWIRGRSLLAGLRWQTAWCRSLEKWNERFVELNVNHKTYSHEWFNSKYVVYVMASPSSDKDYIGSTSVTVSGRHQTRKRKLRQVERHAFASCELAVRFWSRKKNFTDFCPIVYRRLETRDISLAHEAADISTFQPKLNAPFMSAEQVLGKKNSFQDGISYFVPMRKLLIRVRHAKSSDLSLGDRARTLQKTTRILYNLGATSFRRFEQMRVLWTSTQSIVEILTLVRMCQHIDEPFRSRAQRALTTLLIRRKKKWPTKPFPLVLPFLCNVDFKKVVQDMLKSHIQLRKDQLIPLHWPPIKVLEGKHQQLGDALYNWRKWQREFIIEPPQDCCCQSLLLSYPDAPAINGHVVGPGSEFPFPETLLSVLRASAKDSYYPAKKQYIASLQDIFQKWCRRNNNVPLLTAATLANKIWPAHLKALALRTVYTFADVVKVRKLLEGFVIHCEDHEPTRFCIYCPLHYFKVISRTFTDKSVFGQLQLGPSALLAMFPTLVPTDLLKRYRWGLNFESRLPSAYVLIKRKKAYEKARPIISYAGTTCAVLFSALGKILMDLIPKTYPANFGNGNIDQFFSEVHRYLQQEDIADHRMFNDDLVGFFVSVPHERIEASIAHFVSTYYRNSCRHTSLADVKFTVNTSKLAKFRTIRGRTIKANKKTFLIHLEDIPQLVQFSLTTSFFEALGSCYFQLRGSPIGSQCSPAICAIVVAHKEVLWKHSYDVTLHSTGLFLRYVDNRLICLPPDICALPEYQLLTDLNFYLHPVQLEECGTLDVLGFELFLDKNQCRFKFPGETHQFRSPLSAGSQQKTLSGFQSRLYLIAKRTWPIELVRPSAARLVQLYQDKGFDAVLLRRLARRILQVQLYKRTHHA